MVVVTFGSRPGSWAGRILDQQGPSVVLGVTATASAIVGKFRTYVAVVVGGGMKRTKRNPETDMYLLFNAWCPGTSSSPPPGGPSAPALLLFVSLTCKFFFSEVT